MKNKKILLHCSTSVNKDAVSREIINGIEHIIISSFTLPFDIVMNGGIYPKQEILQSFDTLERALAPCEHPQDSDGNFISATDPIAINNYYVGAFNRNARVENNRVAHDFVVNVQEAVKSDKGKRLLDRIDELENNDNPRPVHTSVGVFLISNELDEPRTNAVGQEYTWVASDMVIDHNAILLDSVGAAQPSQGVGMAVNNGDEVEVQEFTISALENNPVPDATEMSHEEIRDALFEAIKQPPINGDWIAQVFETEFIFESGDSLFSAPYTIESGIARIVGIPLPVERDVTFKPRTNKKGDAMKEVIVNALKAANIETENLDDDQLLAEYNKLQANQSDDDNEDETGDADSIANQFSDALSPVIDKLNTLETKMNAKDDNAITEYAEIVGNSDKYPGLDSDSAKMLGIEKLKEMAANCATSHALPFNNQEDAGDDSLKPSEMPE